MLSTNSNRLLLVHRRKTLRSSLKAALAFTGGILCAAAPAAARDNGLSMSLGTRTTQPIGHFEYCKRHLRDCNAISLVTTPVKLSRSRWKQLVSVNTAVNAAIEPVSDLEVYGKEEVWTFPKKKGDCEDYVLLKRKKLMELGWPASSLLITVVRRPNNEGHAVLTARTDRGDYILDNMVDKISAWEATPYRFVKRQSENHSGYWVSINDKRPKRYTAENRNAYDVGVKGQGLISAYSDEIE